MLRIRYVAALVAAMVLSVGAWTRADVYLLEFSDTFSNNVVPNGTAPWLTATFEDVVGGVQLTMENLTTSDFVSEMYLNVDGAALAGLGFTYVSDVQASSITKDLDNLKADGDGNYDILLTYPTAKSDPRFTAGTKSVYLLTGVTVADFVDQLSTGSKGNYNAAAHVQGITGDPNGTSTWVRATPGTIPGPTIPLPPAAWPGVALLAAMGAMRLRRLVSLR